MTPEMAKERGIQFDIMKFSDNAVIYARIPDRTAAVASIAAMVTDDPCSGAWSIVSSQSRIEGLGPLMYDLLMDVVSPHPLAPDRGVVSKDAKRVWDYYLSRRSDIESVQLDDQVNSLTDDPEDNCSQRSSMEWDGRKNWPTSSLSKAYRRRGGGSPTFDALKSLGALSLRGQRVTIGESNLRQVVRENLLTEAKINYPGGDSIHGVFDYWKFTIRSSFEVINGRWPTYGEFVGLIEESVPGFRFDYGATESPDDVIDSVLKETPGGKFLDKVYRQLVRFINNDDRKDLKASRGIERVGNSLRREADSITKEKRRQETEAESRRAAEYEATYEPKAPPDSPLGKYAFSPQRQMRTRPPPMEKNTGTENALLRSIRNHFEGERPLTRQQAQLAIGFIRDGLYPDVFKEAPAGTYYRGMLLDVYELEGMGIDITRMEPDAKKQEMRGNFEIKPLDDRFSSSWSSSFEVAENFSLGRGSRGRTNLYAVVFAATTTNNPGKFLDAEGFYGVDLDDFDDFTDEKEVIGLGTIWANWVEMVSVS